MLLFNCAGFVNSPSNLSSVFISGLFAHRVLWSVCVTDWKMEIKFNWQGVPLCLPLCIISQGSVLLQRIFSLHYWLSSPFPNPLSPLGLSLQAKSCICHMCGAHLNRLHSCLYCVFFGCFTKKHIHEHAKNKRHNLGKPHSHSQKFKKSFWSKPKLTNCFVVLIKTAYHKSPNKKKTTRFYELINDNINILSLPTGNHVSPHIHMHPYGPLQHQLLSVKDYSITLGNFLLWADRELNL